MMSGAIRRCQGPLRRRRAQRAAGCAGLRRRPPARGELVSATRQPRQVGLSARPLDRVWRLAPHHPGLLEASRAVAFLRGRGCVVPGREGIARTCCACILLTYEAEAENVTDGGGAPRARRGAYRAEPAADHVGSAAANDVRYSEAGAVSAAARKTFEDPPHPDPHPHPPGVGDRELYHAVFRAGEFAGCGTNPATRSAASTERDRPLGCLRRVRGRARPHL